MTTTTIDVVTIIGPGTGNNRRVRFITHTTVNADGEVTADVSVGGVTCE